MRHYCSLCGKRLYTYLGMIYHVRWYHEISPDWRRGYEVKKRTDRPYECWLCGEKFKHFIQLKKHIREGIHGTPEEQHNQRVERKRNIKEREHR